jgi:hypothetical protein
VIFPQAGSLCHQKNINSFPSCTWERKWLPSLAWQAKGRSQDQLLSGSQAPAWEPTFFAKLRFAKKLQVVSA